MRLVVTLIFALFFAVSYTSYSYAFFDDLKKLEQDLKDLGDALEDLDNLNKKTPSQNSEPATPAPQAKPVTPPQPKKVEAPKPAPVVKKPSNFKPKSVIRDVNGLGQEIIQISFGSDVSVPANSKIKFQLKCYDDFGDSVFGWYEFKGEFLDIFNIYTNSTTPYIIVRAVASQNNSIYLIGKGTYGKCEAKNAKYILP